MNRSILSFIAKSTIIYSLAYLFVGAVAYQLLTSQFYTGENPVFTAYLRSESNPAEWAHTNLWLVPGLLLRALLISIVLLPIVETLRKMTFWKRVSVLFGLTFVLLHLAAAAPSPSNIEGLIYMKPELVGIKTFLLTQPEMIFQSLLFAVGLSWVLKKDDKKSTRK